MWQEVAMSGPTQETLVRSLHTRAQSGSFMARPSPFEPHPPPVPGLHALDLSRMRDGLYHVPYSYDPERPAPLLVMLHDAGGDAKEAMAIMIDFAEEHGIILMAPESRESSWDLTEIGYGADAQFIDRALEKVFTLYAVDPSHLAIAGFSDGASYALALALGNGELFTHAIGFAPGFFGHRRSRQAPRVYITHGILDQEYDIDFNSRRIVPAIRARGYEVTYSEFEGGHSVPRDVSARAIEWFMTTPGPQSS